MPDAPRIAVIGAGLAGLVAAERLQRAGVHAIVVGEAAPEELEHGPSLLPRSAPELVALAAELGESAALKRASLEGLTVSRNGEQEWVPLATRPGITQALGQRRLRSLLAWFGPKLDPRMPERGVRLDDRSVADFARLYLGRRALERFVPLFADGLGLDANEASRLVLMLLFDPTGQVVVSSVRGVSAIAAALVKRLEDHRSDAVATRVGGRTVDLAEGNPLEVDATLVATGASEVLALVPDLCPAEALFFRRELPFAVGHYRGVERLRREQEARFDKRRLLFCGDYMVAPHAEGAVTAGIRGAEELLSRL